VGVLTLSESEKLKNLKKALETFFEGKEYEVEEALYLVRRQVHSVLIKSFSDSPEELTRYLSSVDDAFKQLSKIKRIMQKVSSEAKGRSKRWIEEGKKQMTAKDYSGAFENFEKALEVGEPS